MADKQTDDELTQELLSRYGMSQKLEEPKVAASTSTPANEIAIPENPFVALEEKKAFEEKNAPVSNVLQRNLGATATGGVLGGIAQYKGLGKGLFQPDPTLFSPTLVTEPSSLPSAESIPMSNVEHTMQSAQGQRLGETGRQRENAQHWESNRQSLATKANLQLPGAANTLVQAGEFYPTESGVGIPKSVAVDLERELKAKQAADAFERQQILEKQAALEKQQLAAAQRRASIAGAGRGLARIGQGVVGGALAAPNLIEYAQNVANQKPADTTQLLGGLGGLMMALGRGKMGAAGALAQIPYAIKHRNELARSMNLSDINPTAFMGMPEELSPAFTDIPEKPKR